MQDEQKERAEQDKHRKREAKEKCKVQDEQGQDKNDIKKQGQQKQDSQVVREFDETLFCSLVDKIVVHSDKQLTFEFLNGEKVEVKGEKII